MSLEHRIHQSRCIHRIHESHTIRYILYIYPIHTRLTSILFIRVWIGHVSVDEDDRYRLSVSHTATRCTDYMYPLHTRLYASSSYAVSHYRIHGVWIYRSDTWSIGYIGLTHLGAVRFRGKRVRRWLGVIWHTWMRCDTCMRCVIWHTYP